MTKRFKMTFDADESLKTISKFLALNCLLAKYECQLCNLFKMRIQNAMAYPHEIPSRE